VEARVFGVRHLADDLVRRFLSLEPESLANRTGVAEVVLRERLIDDGDGRAVSSSDVKSRPASCAVPSVWKYFGPTQFSEIRRRACGFSWNASTDTKRDAAPPSIGVIALSAAERTPGIASSRARRSW
jgi:hypothetical protein